MTRDDVTFESAGVTCAAWLYRPDGATGHVPIVVLGHGLGCTRDMGLDGYAREFVAAGYAALAFDYRSFGDSAGEPRQVLGVRRELTDWRAALAYVRALPGIDTRRVAIWGTSFGGGHTMELAASEPALAAAVAQCPFSDGPASLTRIPPLTAIRLAMKGFSDLLRTALGKSPTYVPLASNSGALAMMSQPDVMPGFEALTPPGSTFQNKVAARLALTLAFARPGAKLKRARCPVLLSVSDHDSLCPSRVTKKLAARGSSLVETVVYPVGHFDVYSGVHRERAVTDQLAFFAKHLGPARPTRLAEGSRHR